MFCEIWWRRAGSGRVEGVAERLDLCVRDLSGEEIRSQWLSVRLTPTTVVQSEVSMPTRSWTGEVEILSYDERLPGGAVQRQDLTQRTNCAGIH